MSKGKRRGNQNDPLFDKVKKETNVSEQKIKKLANQVKPEDLQDERKVRHLIANVAAMAGVSVSKEKEDQIVDYLVKNKVSIQEMQAMINMFMNQK